MTKMVNNGKNDQNGKKMVKITKWSKLAKMTKMVNNGKNDQNGQKWQKLPKWSKLKK